jgi:predicted secreted protein
MAITTALASFFLIWWVTLFAVLPWGVRSQHEGGDMVPGTDPGAPASLKLGRKLLWTTLVAVAIYAVCYVVYAKRWVTLDGLLAPFVYTNRQYISITSQDNITS